MAKLKIIRASAGSGKTFFLTQSYIKLLLDKPPDYYKHILAVTFTNKATSEMKGRILKELFFLASNQKSDMLDPLKKDSGLSESKIRDKAGNILEAILHSYSWFRVETIDTFFQSVIRSFVRELNIPGQYSLELDQDKILDEAINRLLDKLNENSNLVEWLLEYIDHKLKKGDNWVIKSNLQKLGKSLFKEELLQQLDPLEERLNDQEGLKQFRNTLYGLVNTYEQTIINKATSVIKKVEGLGLQNSDFYYNGTGTFNYFLKLANNELIPPSGRILQLLDNPEKWGNSKSHRKEEVNKLGSTLLNPVISEVQEFILEESYRYNSAKVILKNLHILGLLKYLNQELKALEREKGLMLISDAPVFIQKIINENDTPFIYEKVGNRFHHLLIDEFQDTSSMQWGNFKPLLSNGLSGNYDSILVGDIKQSIYRWRNSNWEILASNVQTEFGSEIIENISLTTNWRSSKKIIQFNNHFFENLSGQFQADSDKNIDIGALYNDVAQQSAPHKLNSGGYINITCFSKEEAKNNEQYYGPALISKINHCIKNGYQPGDITVLVRKKGEGAQIAEFLIDANKNNEFIAEVGVISNESLFLINSNVVHLLTAALSFVYDQDNKLIGANLFNAYKQVFVPEENHIHLPPKRFHKDLLTELIGSEFVEQCSNLRMDNLYALAEGLSNLLHLSAIAQEKVYLHAFLDIVFNFSTTEISDLNSFLDFWQNEGHKKSISAAETPDAIKVLTIHKSKGLEFPVVIIPFCNWSILPMTNETLWMQTKTQPFDALPTLPINYEKILEESVFEDQYTTENYKTLVDNINLLYVAFTRPETTLFGFLIDSGNQNNSGDLIKNTLDKLLDQPEMEGIKFNPENRSYEFGVMAPISNTHIEGTNTVVFSGDEKLAKLPKIKVSSYARKHLEDSEQIPDAAKLGRILHATMEKISTVDDIDQAIALTIQEGLLSANDGNEIKAHINQSLSNPKVSSWFKPGQQILKEIDIITKGGYVNRPDRVVFSKTEVAVIDYKFGASEENEKHLKQIKSYISLIQNMGHENVKGYLWYIMEDLVISV